MAFQSDDKELKAIHQINKIVKDLSAEETKRVLDYVYERVVRQFADERKNGKIQEGMGEYHSSDNQGQVAQPPVVEQPVTHC